MNVPEQVAKLCQAFPPDKQAEVLDFVEFLVSRQSHPVVTLKRAEEPTGSRVNSEVADTLHKAGVYYIGQNS